MKTVYIETSIVSYLTARPARDLLAAAWQASTTQWWESQRERFELYTSQLVIAEANQGDVQAAAKRTAALDGIPLLPVSSEATQLADALLQGGALPVKAADDALHVAISAFSWY